MLNENLNKADAQWLISEFYPKSSGRIANNTIGMFIKAINLMRGTDTKVPSCACEWKQSAALSRSYYGQYENEIKVIATQTTKRKKNAI